MGFFKRMGDRKIDLKSVFILLGIFLLSIILIALIGFLMNFLANSLVDWILLHD
jgi:hypothetical protein